MNGLGTIEHNFNAPWYDDHLQRSKQDRMKHPYAVSACYRDKSFRINPKWHRCFTGREEYT